MTTVADAPKGAKDPALTSGVAQYFTPIVIDLSALSLEGKQAHWHVRGSNFQPVHELLDTLVEHTREWTDLAAERVAALGLPLDARTATIAQKATVPGVTTGFQKTDVLIADIIAGIDATLVSLRAAIEGLEEIDPVSQDIAIAITNGLEQDRWFLYSHIAE